MKPPFRIVLMAIAIGAISAPIGVTVTLFLFPLWSWIEATTGIESMGHSGPAAWCYVAVYIVLVVGAALLAIKNRRRA